MPARSMPGQVNGAPSRDNNDKPLVKKINITTEYNQSLLQFSFTCWTETSRFHPL